MRQNLSCILAILALGLIAACSDDSSQSALLDVCAGVDCAGHGQCEVNAGKLPVCVCDSGYHLSASNLTICEPDTVAESPCKDVDCGGKGICAAKSDGSA